MNHLFSCAAVILLAVAPMSQRAKAQDVPVPRGVATTAPDLSEKAFEGAQWVLATSAARAVSQVGARLAAGDGPLADRIRARQQIEVEIERMRRTLAQGGDRPATMTEMTRLQDALDRADATIRAEFPNYDEFANPRPLSYADVRAHLAPDEALIMVLSDRMATYVWAITPGDAAWDRADLSASDLETLVRRVRADLDPTGPARAAVSLAAPATVTAAPAFDADASRALYDALLAPFEEVLAGANHIYVVKDGALASLPLGVLLAEDAALETAEDFRVAPWALTRHAFTTLPAVTSLPNAAAARGTAGELGRFAGFGDPAFAGQDSGPESGPGLGPGSDGEDGTLTVASRSIEAFFTADGTQVDAIRRLSPLPGTRRELRQIAQVFAPGAAVLRLGTEATETAVKTTDFAGVTVISFATHGLVTGDISGLAEPALAFTPPDTPTPDDDGLLTASEAAALKLDADWVILSACNTAAGDGTPGAEGLSGLARAFLFAGARSILVSHWPVRDDVAARLTADTIGRLAASPDMRRAEALRQAVLDLMADHSDASLAHPSAWAPFVIVGAGGRL